MEWTALTAGSLELQYSPQARVCRARLAGPVRCGRVSDVALILAVLCISGNPVALWPAGHETTYAIVAAILASVLFLRRGLGGRAVRAFVPIGFVFVMLSIVHAYAFNVFPIITVVGFLTRLFIGMAVVIMVSDFVGAYVVAMMGLSLLSFVFWVPEYIASLSGIPFHQFFRTLATQLGSQPDDRWCLGFHTYLTDPQQMHRNSGIFWEPGAFAGYIIIALVMLAVLRSSLTRKRHLTALCILTGALLSTFSTAGYVAYPIALLLNYDWRDVNWGRRSGVALMVAPLAIFGSIYAFNKLDFLQPKIREQISAVERREYGWRINRIGTLVYDWEYFSGRPLTGWGLHKKTNLTLDPQATDLGFGNGMASFIVKFGLVGFGVFLFGLVRGASHMGGKSRAFVFGFLASTLVVLQGEHYLDYPLFLALMFLGHASVRSQRLLSSRFVHASCPVRVLYGSQRQVTKV